MYRHPSLPWNMTCRAAAPPPPTPVPPATFSSYSCVGPAPFLSPSNSSYTLKTGLNRQRVCMLRNVCVVDMDMIAADDALEERLPQDDAAVYDTIYALKGVRAYRPRHLVSIFGSGLQSSAFEELVQQPFHGRGDGEGLVHLHAWENHHGGDPWADKHVLGASPWVS